MRIVQYDIKSNAVEVEVGNVTRSLKFYPDAGWKLFPHKENITFVNLHHGLVVFVQEKKDCDNLFNLEMYSLHNSADIAHDYNSVLMFSYINKSDPNENFESVIKDLKALIESDMYD